MQRVWRTIRRGRRYAELERLEATRRRAQHLGDRLVDRLGTNGVAVERRTRSAGGRARWMLTAADDQLTFEPAHDREVRLVLGQRLQLRAQLPSGAGSGFRGFPQAWQRAVAEKPSHVQRGERRRGVREPRAIAVQHDL